jgi:hypothetical protein
MNCSAPQSAKEERDKKLEKELNAGKLYHRTISSINGSVEVHVIKYDDKEFMIVNSYDGVAVTQIREWSCCYSNKGGRQ